MCCVADCAINAKLNQVENLASVFQLLIPYFIDPGALNALLI